LGKALVLVGEGYETMIVDLRVFNREMTEHGVTHGFANTIVTLSSRVEMAKGSEIDKKLKKWLKEAYDESK
jgi:hypothetical protein